MTDFFFLTTFYSGGRLVARSTPRHACLIIPLLNLLLTACCWHGITTPGGRFSTLTAATTAYC